MQRSLSRKQKRDWDLRYGVDRPGTLVLTGEKSQLAGGRRRQACQSLLTALGVGRHSWNSKLLLERLVSGKHRPQQLSERRGKCSTPSDANGVDYSEFLEVARLLEAASRGWAGAGVQPHLLLELPGQRTTVPPFSWVLWAGPDPALGGRKDAWMAHFQKQADVLEASG